MSRGTILVSGASTGIGEASARHLMELGFDVLAGVRKDADAERLREAGARPLKLDVIEQGSIDAARAEVGDVPLAGLVNNAGIAVSGPLEFVPIEELRDQLEVNVIGQVAVTQAFLPALRKAGGRIVNISSIGGRIALPLAGPYNASKFALEAVSDSLRRELRGQGIEVSVVEPGGIKTPIWEKGAARAGAMQERMGPGAQEHYGGLMQAVRARSTKIATETGLPPEEVAKAVGHALTASKPKTRYLVGRDATVRGRLSRVMPDRVMDAAIARALGQRKRT
jgi:NAD(P)-dependent dehydrogenase (short-subunit alcohol dehydrogenase family)